MDDKTSGNKTQDDTNSTYVTVTCCIACCHFHHQLEILRHSKLFDKLSNVHIVRIKSRLAVCVEHALRAKTCWKNIVETFPGAKNHR